MRILVDIRESFSNYDYSEKNPLFFSRDHVWLVHLTFIDDSTDEMQEMHTLSESLGIQQNQPTTLAHLAHIFFFMSDYDHAIAFCHKSISEESDNIPATIHSLCILGQACVNDFKIALDYFEQALKLQLEYDSKEENMLASIYNNLGFAHRRLQSEKNIVMSYYEKAYEMCTSNSHEENVNWCLAATILNNMVTADSHGDSDVALERELLVLNIRCQRLPLSHPLISATHRVLGEIYCSRGDFENALEHFDQALQLRVKYLSNQHVSIFELYASIGLLYLYKGDYEMTTLEQKDAAIDSYNKSLQLYSEVFNSLISSQLHGETDYMELSAVLNGIGVVYTRLERYDEALDFLSMHQSSIASYLPKKYYDHGAVLKNIGRIYMLQGKMEKSMEFYTQALDFFEEINLSISSIVAQINFYMGEWYERMQQKQLSINYYQQAIHLSLVTLWRDHPTIKYYQKTLQRIQRSEEVSTLHGTDTCY